MLNLHHVPGQMNIYVLDKDSLITGYGTHNRLTVFRDAVDHTSIELCEDDIGLAITTEAQRRRVAVSSYMRIHPRGTHLEYVKSEASNGSTWHYYKAVPNKKRG